MRSMQPPTPTRSRLRTSVYVLLGLLLLVIAWLATHALGDDARPALGQLHTVSGVVPLQYYVQEPAQATAQTETVVLVASLGRPASDFNELRSALAQAGYRTVAVESRGVTTWAGGGLARYTLQDLAGDIRTALADAGVPPQARVHVVGHAFGNRVARTFATLYPQQTAGLVLVAAGDKTDTMPPEVRRNLLVSTLSVLPWWARAHSVETVFFASGNAVPAYWQRGWSFWGALAQSRAAQAVDKGEFHAGGTGPMLVLQAQDDVIAPPQDAGEVLKASYGARVTLVAIPQAGHAQLPEQPARIAEAVLAFLQAHPAH